MVGLWLAPPNLYGVVGWHVGLVDAPGRERWATSFPAQMSVIDGSTGRPRLRRMDELVSMARGGVSISGDPGVFAVHLMAPRDDLWFEVERAAFDHDNLLADAIPRPLTVRPLPGETSSGSIPPG